MGGIYYRCRRVAMVWSCCRGGVMEACSCGSLWDRNRACFSLFSASHEGFLYRIYQTNMELNPRHVMLWKCPISPSQWNKTTAVKGSAAIICSLVIITAPALSHAAAVVFSSKIFTEDTKVDFSCDSHNCNQGSDGKEPFTEDFNRFFSVWLFLQAAVKGEKEVKKDITITSKRKKTTFFPTLPLLLIIVRILKNKTQQRMRSTPHKHPTRDKYRSGVNNHLQDLYSSCCNQHPSHGRPFVSSASAYSISVTELPVPRSIKKLMHQDVLFIIHHHKQEARRRLGNCWGSFCWGGQRATEVSVFPLMLMIPQSSCLFSISFKWMKRNQRQRIRVAPRHRK